MQNQILEILYKNKGKYVSPAEITSLLNINQDDLEKNVAILEECGYIIDSSYESGIRLIESTHLILPYEIKKELKTNYIGHKIHYFSKIDSTNIAAKKLAEDGAQEGTIVIAETQTRGRGRRGKKWISPTGGIWMSIILRPKISPAEAPQLTLMTGVAVAKTIKNKFELDVGIKWPNDILIGSCKVCGILTEANAKFNTLDYVVIGIGIDANVETESFPSDIRKNATSLKKELGEEINGSELIQDFLKIFEDNYDALKKGQFPEILVEWRKLSKTIGSYVEVHKQGGKIVKGEAIGINKDGVLILERDNGTLRKIISGECLHRKKP